MTWVTAPFSHGGNGLAKAAIESLLSFGWVERETVDGRLGGLDGAGDTQTGMSAVSFAATGLPLDFWVPLPVCMIGDDYVPRLNGAGAPLVEGTDFDIDRVRGRIQFLTAGAFDGGGVVIGTFTIDAGWTARRGWMVFESAGISGQEGLMIGLRFDRISLAPGNPIKTGPRWTLFRNWVNGITDYDVADFTIRNDLVNDVLQYVDPNFEGEFAASVNQDRIICHGKADCFSAWAYVGALTRLRPQLEQDSVLAMAGNQAALDVDDIGPIGDTDFAGSTTNPVIGSAWLYDLGQFATFAEPVDLNCNTWSREAGSSTAGYTPSRFEASPGNVYFELHDAVVGRNVELLNDPTSVIYGVWSDVKAVLKADARHGDQLFYGGTIYRLLQVGSNPRRHIAVAEV